MYIQALGGNLGKLHRSHMNEPVKSFAKCLKEPSLVKQIQLKHSLILLRRLVMNVVRLSGLPPPCSLCALLVIGDGAANRGGRASALAQLIVAFKAQVCLVKGSRAD